MIAPVYSFLVIIGEECIGNLIFTMQIILFHVYICFDLIVHYYIQNTCNFCHYNP